MNLTQNVVLDFTSNKSINGMLAGQPVAIMPAELAKKLLADYATKLSKTTLSSIITGSADGGSITPAITVPAPI